MKNARGDAAGVLCGEKLLRLEFQDHHVRVEIVSVVRKHAAAEVIGQPEAASDKWVIAGANGDTARILASIAQRFRPKVSSARVELGDVNIEAVAGRAHASAAEVHGRTKPSRDHHIAVAVSAYRVATVGVPTAERFGPLLRAVGAGVFQQEYVFFARTGEGDSVEISH